MPIGNPQTNISKRNQWTKRKPSKNKNYCKGTQIKSLYKFLLTNQLWMVCIRTCKRILNSESSFHKLNIGLLPFLFWQNSSFHASQTVCKRNETEKSQMQLKSVHSNKSHLPNYNLPRSKPETWANFALILCGIGSQPFHSSLTETASEVRKPRPRAIKLLISIFEIIFKVSHHLQIKGSHCLIVQLITSLSPFHLNWHPLLKLCPLLIIN